MAAQPERRSGPAHVFGYASLVALRESLLIEGVEHAAFPGRLLGFRRLWGAAMDNWDPANDRKHFLDRATGERPHIRVAYLDVEPSEGGTVNGLAIPVDPGHLAALDAREVNYSRIEVSDAFVPASWPGGESEMEGRDEPRPVGREEPRNASRSRKRPPAFPRRVFAYVGTEAARERCRQGAADRNVFVSRDYIDAVRCAFEQLAPDALAEFDRTTGPPPFPERDLQVVLPA